MKKNVTLLTACIVCAAGIAIGACADEVVEKIQAEVRQDFTVKIDGEVKTFQSADGKTVYPILYEGTTYLPLRAIGNIMGKTVYWYEADKLIELKDEDSTVTDADVIVPENGNNGNNSNKDKNGNNGNGNNGNGQLNPGLTPTADEITLDKAKSIAFEKAGVTEADVTLTKARLEMDDGIRKYDIEFVDLRPDSKNIEYSAEIRASDGVLIDWDIDEKYIVGGSGGGTSNSGKTEPAPSGEITADQAKAIALQKAGLNEADVTGMKVETDTEHGTKQYEVEFRQGRKEYSAEINAADGSIIKWEAEND